MPADPSKSDLNAGAAPIRVLVVDDQSFMRIALRQILEAEGDIRVVGEARNGVEAVAMAHELKPDAITLDVEMPEMDGLQACEQIMREVQPRPAIIMVSAYTQAGAEAAVQALRLGAVDFVSKSSIFAATDLAHIDSELRPKLRAWAKRRLVAGPSGASAKAAAHKRRWHPDLVVIAASTGGPAGAHQTARHFGADPAADRHRPAYAGILYGEPRAICWRRTPAAMCGKANIAAL